MSKATTIQKIKDNVYENVNNEVTGQMAQDAMIEIVNDEYTELGKKQDKLVSGTNIKTVQGQSLLGSGNVALSAGSLNAYTKPETDALLNTKVPKTTKVNGKALTGDITLTASDVSALPDDTKYAGSSSVGGAATSANKVNSTLTIQTNGTSAGTFNGSANTTVNITASGVGTYTKAEIDAKDTALDTKINTKQNTLVSGTNIKTVNNTTLLGSGNVAVQPTLVSGTNIKTINGTSVLGTGDISVGAGINVINNLSSTSTTDALSAYQGKVLNDTIKFHSLNVNTDDLSFIKSMNRIQINSITNDTYINYFRFGNVVTYTFNIQTINYSLSDPNIFSFTLVTPYKSLRNTYSAGYINNITGVGGDVLPPIKITAIANQDYITIAFYNRPAITNTDILNIGGSITYSTTDPF